MPSGASAPATDVPSARRIGVFGGTFDPIHLGHLAAASEVLAALQLDEVIFVPAHAQPLKPAPIASATRRVAMLELAVGDNDDFSTSRVDIERGGVTYTVDTLTDLQREHPDAELTFIAGADAVATLDRWREPERLRTLARFVGVTRPGHPRPEDANGVRVVDVPGVAVSSTEVRRRVSIGAPIRYLVPDAVVHYIAQHELYLGGDA
jgi:nicotinate-nucleotide adenylyltransferase